MPDAGSGFGGAKWRIRCNKCLFMFEGFEDATRVVVDSESRCNGCKSRLVTVAFKATGGEKLLKGCIFCTPELSSQLRVRVGERVIQGNQTPSSSGNNLHPQNGAPPAPSATVSKPPAKTQKAPTYSLENDPNTEERASFGGRGGGRGFRGGGRGGRGRGRGGRRGGRGGGRGGHRGGDDDGDYSRPSRGGGLMLSDFLK